MQHLLPGQCRPENDVDRTGGIQLDHGDVSDYCVGGVRRHHDALHVGTDVPTRGELHSRRIHSGQFRLERADTDVHRLVASTQRFLYVHTLHM